jgi:hypothetical protein
LTLRIALAGRAGDLAAGGLAAGDLEKISDAAEGTTRTEDLLVLLQAVAGLGPRAERAAAWVVTQLEHGVEEVRVRAIRALAQLAWPGGIEPLIARIDVESGRAREEVLDALVVLTGAHPGDSAPSWRLWLAQEGGPFVRGEARLGRGDASVRGRPTAPPTLRSRRAGIAAARS